MYNELDYAWSHANIGAELQSVRPLGDCVLVRVIPEPEMSGSIIMPTGSHERGYQPPRLGEVIACGPGDKLPFTKKEMERLKAGLPVREWADNHVCDIRADVWWSRAPMHVKPGDRILYWRCQANEVVINNETYQLLREQQHILAVLEN